MSETYAKKYILNLFLIILFLFLCQVSFGNETIEYTGAGDNKDGYDSKDYETNSLSLDDRQGKKADLIKYVTTKQLGLSLIEIPDNNPITQKKIELGKKLFFDRERVGGEGTCVKITKYLLLIKCLEKNYN